MLICFTANQHAAIPLIPLLTEEFEQWIACESQYLQNWAKAVNFFAKPETFCVIPNAQGNVEKVLVGMQNKKDFWSFGELATCLPSGSYKLEQRFAELKLAQVATAWGLGAYQFNRYKKSTKTVAQLVISNKKNLTEIESVVASIYWVRDLINTPTDDMGPAELAKAAQDLAQEFNAQCEQIIGEDLLKQNYPTIYAVGRASNKEPRLIDLRWDNGKAAPKITLIGKGVCFDTGGLDLKSTSGMALMKKDMAGAAHVLGLARMIMAAQLPVSLRVLIPAVENSVSGNAYHPGDIITTRKGISVEITNTDAEGRLILGDALAEASTESPDLIIDIATLTGAARVATGAEVSALFTDDFELAKAIMLAAEEEQDPVWPLPLHSPYRKLLNSSIADICNASTSPYAGAITAALYLKEFIDATISWAHFDIMAWNVAHRPGRPVGAEAMAIRALFSYLKKRYQ